MALLDRLHAGAPPRDVDRVYFAVQVRRQSCAARVSLSMVAVRSRDTNPTSTSGSVPSNGRLWRSIQRLHVAVASLRKLGLGAAIVYRDGGFGIEPACPLLRVDPRALS